MATDPEWLQKARAEGRITEGKPAQLAITPQAGKPVARKRTAKTAKGWSFTLSITFGLATPSSLNSREHWRARQARVKRERAATRIALEPFPGDCVGLSPIRVVLTRLGGGKMDDDNLPGTMKAVRDEVARWVGFDDGSDWYQWSYAQESGGKEVGVRIEFSLARSEGE